MPEIRCRATHIVDISLEVRHPGKKFRFPDKAVVAPGGNRPALVKGQRAEITSPEASPAGSKGKLHFGDGGNATHLFIHRMVGPLIGKFIDCVHLLCCERILRGVHDDEAIVFHITLRQLFPGYGITVLILPHETLGVLFLILADIFIGRKNDATFGRDRPFLFPHGPADPVDLIHRCSVPQRVRDLKVGPLPHTPAQDIRSAVQQHGPLDRIRPVIIVSETPEARLKASRDHRNIRIGFLDPPGIRDQRVVRTSSVNTVWRIEIFLPLFLRNGIVVDHGIHVA